MNLTAAAHAAAPAVPQFTAGDLKGVLVVVFLILGDIWLLQGVRR